MLKAFYIKLGGHMQLIWLKLSYGMLKRPTHLSYANSVYHDPGSITAKSPLILIKRRSVAKGFSNSKVVF